MKSYQARFSTTITDLQTDNYPCELYKDQCEKQQQCLETELYYVITALCVVICLLVVATSVLYRWFKQEQKLRMTMWKVKWDDICFDKTNWTPLEISHDEIVEKIIQPRGSTISGRISRVLRDGRYGMKPRNEIPDHRTQIMGGKRCKNLHTATGHYKGHIVAVKRLRARRMSLERPKICDLDQIFMLNHEHVCKFYGANYAGTYVTVLTEYCSRGSLQDLLRENGEWDDVFKNSLIFDIVKGMMFLHRSKVHSHGNLKPSNCLIDSRFMVKITDFGCIGQRLKTTRKNNNEKTSPYYRKLWTAPELLRAIIPPNEGSQKGDVYSFSIIAQEILYQRGVFYRGEDAYNAEEIVQRVTSPRSDEEIFRPCLEDDDDVVIDPLWRKVLRKSWAEKAKDRPAFHEIHQMAGTLQKDTNLFDNLLQRLQQYSYRLEEQVEEKTEQYKAEKEKSDSLLYQMLPKPVADRLKLNTDVMPKSYDSVTVYFSDIVGFSTICHQSEPLEVVKMLNDLYTMFDHIIEEFDVYKVETIGDAYMVASGLPDTNGNLHAREIARMALSLVDSVANSFVIQHMPETQLKLRAGIHSGPVVAGVVGLKMPRYCLFGDTVNTAARMEQHGRELKIHVSPSTKEILDVFQTFRLMKRKDSVVLKGLGEWNTWWLLGEEQANVATSPQIVDVSTLDLVEAQKLRLESTTSTVMSSLPDSPTGYCETVFTVENETVEESVDAFEETVPPCSEARRGSGYTHTPRYKRSVLSISDKKRRLGTTARPPVTISYVSGNPCYKQMVAEDGDSDKENSIQQEPKVRRNGVDESSTRRHKAIGRDSGIYLAFDNGGCVTEDDT